MDFIFDQFIEIEYGNDKIYKVYILASSIVEVRPTAIDRCFIDTKNNAYNDVRCSAMQMLKKVSAVRSEGKKALERIMK